MSITYDGNFTIATQNGPLKKWWDSETQAYMYRQSMVQIVANWVKQGWTLKGPDGGYLTEETEPNVEGPLAYWDRVFAWVPPTRVMGESLVYPYQLEFTGGTGDPSIVEIPLSITALVTYDYFYTTDPSTIPINRTYRIGLADGILYSVGPFPADATNAVLQDSSLRQWKGLIWERKTPRGNIADAITAI